MKYRKKPVEIEAFLYKGDWIEVQNWMNAKNIYSPKISYNIEKFEISIPTLEGDITASKGDYIICGVKGEFYPCKPDIFELTYEPI